VLVAALLGMLALAAPAPAAVFNVTTTVDEDDKECANDCTLREAVALGGANDTINVPKGVYTLSLGELLLVGDHIVGGGARDVFIDGANATRMIRVSDGGPSSIAGITLRNGNGQSAVQTGFGGAAIVLSGATLTLTNSTVIDNKASNGGGLAAIGGGLALIGSTVSGNDASAGRLTSGGGIFANSTLLLGNTTVSGNTALDSNGGATSQGGGVAAGGPVLLQNVTIAGNTASSGGGLFMATPQSGTQQVSNTIIGANTGGSCTGSGLNTDTTRNSISADTTCLFTGVADRNGFDPRVGPLTDNGGNTDTRALAPDSPAINQGATCATTDQRGVARPQPAGGVCDIGAFEYRPPVLTVITKVVNDAGGTRTPSAFSVHVREGATDVTGSPQPGTVTGRSYTLAAGSTYTARADAVSGYTLSYSADCTRTMLEGDVRTCTVTANDNAIVRQQQLPPPQPGKNVNALPKTGTVRVKLPGSDTFVLLDEDRQIPLGTIVDVRNGRVTIVAAAGNGQTADFYDGLFKLSQTKGMKPITVLTLVEKLTACKAKGKASIAAKKRTKRRLWGDGKGRFRTKGKNSAATVLGTKWLVEDRCTSTLTRVRRGKVMVRDFVKKKTVIVKRGKKYIARAR
jgi:CSLREA domain-containing protein